MLGPSNAADGGSFEASVFRRTVLLTKGSMTHAKWQRRHLCHGRNAEIPSLVVLVIQLECGRIVGRRLDFEAPRRHICGSNLSICAFGSNEPRAMTNPVGIMDSGCKVSSSSVGHDRIVHPKTVVCWRFGRPRGCTARKRQPHLWTGPLLKHWTTSSESLSICGS